MMLSSSSWILLSTALSSGHSLQVVLHVFIFACCWLLHLCAHLCVCVCVQLEGRPFCVFSFYTAISSPLSLPPPLRFRVVVISFLFRVRPAIASLRVSVYRKPRGLMDCSILNIIIVAQNGVCQLNFFDTSFFFFL